MSLVRHSESPHVVVTPPGFSRPAPTDTMTNHCCPVTRGRALYERWLWKMWVPPDDLWDHLPDEERMAWEAIAQEADGCP